MILPYKENKRKESVTSVFDTSYFGAGILRRHPAGYQWLLLLTKDFVRVPQYMPNLCVIVKADMQYNNIFFCFLA